MQRVANPYTCDGAEVRSLHLPLKQCGVCYATPQMGRRTPLGHMPEVEVPDDWTPPAMLQGDEPGDWDRAEDLAAACDTTLDHAVEAIRHGLGDLRPSWWNIRAHHRRRDRPPRGFE